MIGKQLKNQRGYLILEVSVAAAIAGAIAYYIGNSIAYTFNNASTVNSALLANQMVQERISKLKSLSGYYVPVSDASGRQGLYVGCYTRQAMTLKGSDSEKVVFSAEPGKPTGLCTSEIEIQFSPSINDSSKITSYVLIYRKADHKDFTIHSREIQLEKTFPISS